VPSRAAGVTRVREKAAGAWARVTMVRVKALMDLVAAQVRVEAATGTKTMAIATRKQ
jgi:hypothetical protein